MSARIQIRRDTAANWSNVSTGNPILASGEIGYETDTGQVKVGDGSTAWNSLDYLAVTLPILTATADYNTMTKTGRYVISDPSSTTTSNGPTAPIDVKVTVDGAGHMLVLKFGTSVLQQLWTEGNGTSAPPKSYSRVYDGGASEWRAWTPQSAWGVSSTEGVVLSVKDITVKGDIIAAGGVYPPTTYDHLVMSTGNDIRGAGIVFANSPGWSGGLDSTIGGRFSICSTGSAGPSPLDQTVLNKIIDFDGRYLLLSPPNGTVRFGRDVEIGGPWFGGAVSLKAEEATVDLGAVTIFESLNVDAGSSNPNFGGKRLTNIGLATGNNDAVRLGQLASTFSSRAVFHYAAQDGTILGQDVLSTDTNNPKFDWTVSGIGTQQVTLTPASTGGNWVGIALAFANAGTSGGLLNVVVRDASSYIANAAPLVITANGVNIRQVVWATIRQ